MESKPQLNVVELAAPAKKDDSKEEQLKQLLLELEPEATVVVCMKAGDMHIYCNDSLSNLERIGLLAAAAHTCSTLHVVGDGTQ